MTDALGLALSGQFIKVTIPEPHVALVGLSRGPVNAFHDPLWLEFGEIFEKIASEPEIRAVVLASTLPKVFSAGIDFGALDRSTYDKDIARHALQLRKHLLKFQNSISAIERCPVPVIVAVHGAAYGLAIDIICACDVRYGASNARYSIKEVDVGLAADIGTLARLPKIAGNSSLVHELSYTAKDFTSSEAAQMGLLSRVVEGGRDEVIRAAVETAKNIAEKSPVAVVGTKRLLLHARDHSVAENLEYTAVWNSAMVQSVDLTDAVKAAQKKQKPQFRSIPSTPKPKL